MKIQEASQKEPPLVVRIELWEYFEVSVIYASGLLNEWYFFYAGSQQVCDFIWDHGNYVNIVLKHLHARGKETEVCGIYIAYPSTPKSLCKCNIVRLNGR